jgi:hypothetical protein
MPFGLGFFELFVVLVMLVVPVVVLVLAAKLISRMFRPGRARADEVEQHQLAAELQRTRIRIEELESRVARVDEKASFTQELLEKPRTGQ